MPETVSFDEELGVIAVRSEGAVREHEFRQTLETIQKFVNETGINDVLVNPAGLESLPGLGVLFGLFASGLPGAWRVAVVAGDDHLLLDEMRFMETVTFNRGFAFKLFGSRDAALAWFKSSGQRPG